MQALRYVGLSLALGLIATWASENLFWFVPPPGLNLRDLGFTWLAYSVAAAACLSAVILTGAGGMRAAFLGGAMLGFLVEGVVVGTIYEAFPVQLVWTPLAWHGLITGALVIGVARSGLPALSLALIWLGFGILLSLWATYWPAERAELPDTRMLLLYLALPALAVALGQGLIDRIGPDTAPLRPHMAVLAVAPVLALAVWILQFALAPDPRRLVLPVILAGLWWLMRRAAGSGWGRPRPLWQHGLILIAPLCAAVLAPMLWARFGAVEANWPVAFGTGILSLAGLALSVRRGPGRQASR